MGAAQDCHPTIGALKTASVYEASLTAASRGRSLSLHLISLICLNITSVGPICIQALRSALCAGKCTCGYSLAYMSENNFKGSFTFVKGLEVCQIALVLCLLVSSASHLTGLVLQVHTTIPALYGPGNPNSGLRAFKVY